MNDVGATRPNIANILGAPHREGDWNEVHKVIPVLQDCDSTDGMATKHF